MGLVIIIALLIYLAVSVGSVFWAVNHAKKNGKSAKLWGFGAAFIMYNLVFWDWIPTVVAHKYYCSTEAGFWVYKTVDQWKAENPGVMETLVPYTDGRSSNGAYILNQRFKWAVKKDGPYFFHRWKWEHGVIDSRTNDVLARYVDYSTGSGFIGGPPRLLKLWLQSDHCADGSLNYGKFISIKREFQGMEK